MVTWFGIHFLVKKFLFRLTVGVRSKPFEEVLAPELFQTTMP
jgi:hypothetical protein